jgi:hypothetical protein
MRRLLPVLLLATACSFAGTIDVTNQGTIAMNTGDELLIPFTLDHFHAVANSVGMPNIRLTSVFLALYALPPNAPTVPFQNTSATDYAGYSFTFTLLGGDGQVFPGENGGVLFSGESQGALFSGAIASAQDIFDPPNAHFDNSQTISVLNTGLPITFGLPPNGITGAVTLSLTGSDPNTGDGLSEGESVSRILLVQATPEPASMLLVASGLLILMGRRVWICKL